MSHFRRRSAHRLVFLMDLLLCVLNSQSSAEFVFLGKDLVNSPFRLHSDLALLKEESASTGVTMANSCMYVPTVFLY